MNPSKPIRTIRRVRQGVKAARTPLQALQHVHQTLMDGTLALTVEGISACQYTYPERPGVSCAIGVLLTPAQRDSLVAMKCNNVNVNALQRRYIGADNMVVTTGLSEEQQRLMQARHDDLITGFRLYVSERKRLFKSWLDARIDDPKHPFWNE